MSCLRLRLAHIRALPVTGTRRAITSGIARSDAALKYEDKLKKRAAEIGAKDVDELRERVRKDLEAEKALKRAEQAKIESTKPNSDTSVGGSSPPAPSFKTRKDDSPIKPLDTILNLSKLLSTSPPLTSAQLGAMWTAYHARREGVLCAVVPSNMYEQMLDRARRWGQFVVPLPRGTKSGQEEKDAEGGTEMFFIEWGVHHSPTLPALDKDVLGFPLSDPTEPRLPTSPNAPIATLLFTPLQEYKHRQSFAAPHLALTFYTDLTASHGVVLLRGEITPAQQGKGRWLLSLPEAQALVVAMQRFYLPGKPEAEELVRHFHERPEGFRWENLLELSDIGVKL